MRAAYLGREEPRRAGDHADRWQDEFKHFGMDLEFLLRRKPKRRIAPQGILFQDGDIVEHGEEAEKAGDE